MIILRNKNFSESKKGPVFNPLLHIDGRDKNGKRVCIPAYIDENGEMKELTEEVWKKYHPEEKKYSDDNKKSKRLQFLRRLSDRSAIMRNNLSSHNNLMINDNLAMHNQIINNNLAMHNQMHCDAVNSHAIASMGHPIM